MLSNTKINKTTSVGSVRTSSIFWMIHLQRFLLDWQELCNGVVLNNQTEEDT